MTAEGFKVVVLGDSGTGKTSIIDCASTRLFRAGSTPTISCSSRTLSVAVRGEAVSLTVWDTAGQELYRSLVPLYLRDASAALLVYDLANPRSLASLGHWRAVLADAQPLPVPLFVVANKADLASAAADGERAADALGAALHVVSAKTGEGVEALFNAVAAAVAAAPVLRVEVAASPAPPRAPARCCA
jgi:small GTP-binding protein